MKKIVGVLIAVILTLALVAPVVAGDGKDNPDRNIGDKTGVAGGYEAEYLGKDGNGNETWQVDLSAPKYLPYDLVTEISCRWEHGKETGEYIIDQNIFAAEVVGDTVTATYGGYKFTWQPVVYVDGVAYYPKDTNAKRLPIDPINSNSLYWWNTLEWDYGVCVRHLRVIEGELLEYFIFDSDPKGEVRIEYDKHEKDKKFTYEVSPCGWDAVGNTIRVESKGNTKIVDVSEFARDDITYPVTLDPTTTFYTSASDGYLYWTDYNWSTARDSSSSEYISSTSAYLVVKADNGFWGYHVYRSYVYFDTSSVFGVVTDAELELYVKSISDDDDGEIYIVSGMPTYPTDPLAKADYNYTYYDSFATTYGYVDVSEQLTTGHYEKINYSDSTALKDIINVSGTTKLCLIERQDKEDDQPNGEVNEVEFYSYEQGEGYRPKLIVTYTAAAPTVNTDAASNIAGTTARLNSTLIDDGGEACEIRWGWGESSELAIEDYDHYTEFDGAYSTGEHPYLDIEELDLSTTYYFRVEAQNSGDTDLGDELDFETTASPDDPANLRAYPSSTSVSLTWAKGTGSTISIVRYRYDTYPTTYTDGFLVYNGTSASYNHTGLTPGTVIYYAVWGESGGHYSTGSAETMTTTTATGAEADDAFDVPDMPEGMYDEPNYTNLSNLPIVYDVVNNFADSLDMPRATMWFFVALGSSLVFGGVAFFVVKRKLFILLLGTTIGLTFWWVADIMPWWVVLISSIASGVWVYVSLRESR